MSTYDIRCSKDGGRNWSAWRNKPLGTDAEELVRSQSTRWGQSRQFVFQIRVTDPVRVDLIAASLRVESEG